MPKRDWSMGQATEELQKMFPNELFLCITDKVEIWKNSTPSRHVGIVVGMHCRVGKFEGSSMAEAMLPIVELVHKRLQGRKVS